MEEGKKEVERCSSGKKTKGHKLTFPPKMGPLHLDLLFVRPKTLQLPKVFCQGPSRFHRREKMVLVACFQNYFVGKAKLVYSPPLLKPNGGPPPSFFLKKQTIAKNSDCQFSPSRLPLLPNPSTASRAHSLRLRRGGSTVLWNRGAVGRWYRVSVCSQRWRDRLKKPPPFGQSALLVVAWSSAKKEKKIAVKASNFG